MIKLRIVILLLCTFNFGAKYYSQTFGNEWINYSQNYYTFEIFQDGLYRLDYATLVNAGIPVATFQSENIQLFGKEKEIPVLIEDGGDNTFDPGDYLVFYAEKNSYWLDSLFYDDPADIGNPGYNLYNDTLHYFFTWNSSSNNLRFTQESDVNFSNYSSIANYIWYSSKLNINTHYYEGKQDPNVSSSFYTRGEGWAEQHKDGVSGSYSPTVLNVPTPNPYVAVGAPNAIFSGRSVSTNDAATVGFSSPNHHVRWLFGTSNTLLLDTTWKGYDQIRCDEIVSNSLLSNGTTPVTYRIINDLSVATDRQSFQYLSLDYARQTDFNGGNELTFKVENDPQGKIRLDFTNTGTMNPIVMVFGSAPRIVPFVPNGGSYSMLIPNSTNGVNQEVIVKDISSIQDVTELSPVNGTGIFTDFASQLPESALLMIYHPSMNAASQAYKSYRDFNYNAYLANIEELYLQFGGGIRKHVFGVRRFAHFAYVNSTNKPVGLFLMGKGIRESSTNSTTFDGAGTRKSPSRYALSHIPSYGQPSSDISITAGLEGTSNYTPLIPTGRISVRDNQELQDYLNKVQVYEENQNQNDIYDTPNKDWQKHVMHFAGGVNAGEQTQFQSYMNAMSNTISDSLFGAYVHKIYKTSSNPLDPTLLAEVTDRISDGLSLMSYFGHATGTNSGFEINLDDPVNWDNEGKYPVMFVNSCYNGNVFQETASKAEEFVQVADYGAIAYIATVSLGLSGQLNQYAQRFYNGLSRDNYGQSLGEIMMNSTSQLETLYPGNLSIETICTQMVLNGDPMLKLNWHTAPEIELTPDDISFSPNTFDLTIDSIEMQIVLTNLGVSITDTFQVEVTRHFPQNGIDSTYQFYIPKLDYSDTLRFKMPLQANISIGVNSFDVRIDLPSFITEQYEEVTNNEISRTLLIDIDGITPVIPYEFAVVPDNQITLKASTTDPIAPFNTYRFEVDTVDFEGTVAQSSEYRYALVSGLGGVKEVNPNEWLSVATNDTTPLILEDSVVYFWRVSIAGDTTWRESSFQYITGKTGWGQDHFYQFKKNSFLNVAYQRVPRTREFNTTFTELECNINSATSAPEWYFNNYLIGGDVQTYGIGVSTTPKIHVAVIDPVTLEPWVIGSTGTNPCFGAFNCTTSGAWEDYHFRQNNAAELDSFQNMVLNEVPDGHYLLIYIPMVTRHDWFTSIDSLGMYSTFQALGSDSLNASRPNRPFAFFMKKGDPSTIIEGYPATQGGEYQLIGNMYSPDNFGIEKSTLIGPANQWGNVYWKQDPSETPTDDSTGLYIIGYDINGVQQTSIYQSFTPDDSLLNLNALIDASQFPYISLRADYSDTVTNTPAQMDRWHVLYEPLPEAAIDGSNGYLWSAGIDPVQEGDSIEFEVDVRNIFNIDMDSLLVSYYVMDENNVVIPIAYPRQDSLRVSDTLRDRLVFSTTGMSGLNSFFMEINPYVNGSFVITDQPEQEHFNNLLQIPFFVEEDDEHPILDVTFNGNHILNGDIVDPYSEILITLKDDNDFLIMDSDSDTTLFGIYITDPSGNQTRVPFVDQSGNMIMQWVPANSQNKRFKIIWPAAFEQDGTYTLSVQGSDKSGNLSGDLDYNVDFEIIHESSITKMMNYPNPFSTSTRFVFTLTGSQVPDDILIQIMTVSGRVIREISEDELGPIQIGRNVTEFAWNGTDQFGDPLANGVYLYRVITKINGEDIENRESGADQYFTKDFGKMYLLR